MSRVILAMSGGVDSSVSAHLLQQQGHDVVGLFMKHGQSSDEVCTTGSLPVVSHKQGCCSSADAADARRVADALGIPFYAINFDREFARIVDYFVDEYVSGRTPNPCIQCNNWLKFGKLFDYADRVGAEYVATGHYARLDHLPDGQIALRQGRDDGKDQAYVLFGIDRGYLPRMMLPVGDYDKTTIRAIAAEMGLRVAEKKDSQEVCFVPDQDHARFIRQRRSGEETSARSTIGQVVTTQGEVVGEHDGIERFTVGQRKGLGIAFGEPRYVVAIDPQSNDVVVGTRDDLQRTQLTAGQANWLIDPPAKPFRCGVKIRYRSDIAPATVTPLGGDHFRVDFDAPRHGVAPGQAAVCYEGDRVLGGGWIE